MDRASSIVDRTEIAANGVADRVRLDLEGRRKRRQVVRTRGGTEFLIDLPAAPALKHGDGLKLACGRIVVVEAEAEALMEVHAGDVSSLVKIAWHLGNRHLPVEFMGSVLRLRHDHVIAHMLKGLGAEVRRVEAPFEPEAGAYEGHHHHSGGHAHESG